MSVSLDKLKNILRLTIVEDFIQEGFSFNKSQFSFIKKIGKNKVRCSFFLYNYAPEKIEYSFIFYFFIQEIEVEKQKFFNHSGRIYKKDYTLQLREGDFHPLVKHEILKYRAAFTHIVTDFEKDKQAIEDSRYVIKTEFFTRVPIFSNLKNFQRLVLKDYEFVINSQGWIISSLIAAKLKSKEELNKLVDFIWINENLSNKDDSFILKRLIVDFITFSEEYSNA